MYVCVCIHNINCIHEIGPKTTRQVNKNGGEVLSAFSVITKMSHHAKTNGVDGIYDDNQNIENASPEKQLIFYKKRYNSFTHPPTT